MNDPHPYRVPGFYDESETPKQSPLERIILEQFKKLNWELDDDISIEIAGTAVSGIDVGEEYNKKWQSPKGTVKYNHDAFIVIKNLDRTPFVPSVAPACDSEETGENG